MASRRMPLLDEEQRKKALLLRIEGLTMKAIGQRMGISVSQLSRILHNQVTGRNQITGHEIGRPRKRRSV